MRMEYSFAISRHRYAESTPDSIETRHTSARILEDLPSLPVSVLLGTDQIDTAWRRGLLTDFLDSWVSMVTPGR